MSNPVSYFRDCISGVVLKFDTLWDLNEMRKNPEYAEVDEKVYKEYVKKRDAERATQE